MKKKIPNHYRQGDVLLMQIDQIPNVKKMTGKTVTVAEGEATGHHHSFVENAVGFGDGKLADFVEVKSPAEIIHQEHGHIKIAPEKYLVGRQVEEGEDEEVRRVAD